MREARVKTESAGRRRGESGSPLLIPLPPPPEPVFPTSAAGRGRRGTAGEWEGRGIFVSRQGPGATFSPFHDDFWMEALKAHSKFLYTQGNN